MANNESCQQRKILKLCDEQLARVTGGSSAEGSTLDLQIFLQKLIEAGAANDSSLAEIVQAAAEGNGGRVGMLLPNLIGNPLVFSALNAALTGNSAQEGK